MKQTIQTSDSSQKNDGQSSEVFTEDAVKEFLHGGSFELCNSCKKSLCEPCERGLKELIVLKAKELLLNDDFKQHCVNLFISNLEKVSNARRTKEAEPAKKKSTPPTTARKEIQPSAKEPNENADDLEEELVDSLIQYQKKARTEPIAEKTIARKSIQPKVGLNKPVAREVAAVAPKPQKKSVTAIRSERPPVPPKPQSPKEGSGKAQKRSRPQALEEDSEPDVNQKQLRSYDQYVSKAVYILRQEEKAKFLLDKMRKHIKAVRAVYDKNASLEYPDFEAPKPELSTRQGVKALLNDPAELRNILNLNVKSLITNVKIASELSKWCKFVNQCYVFAGILKEFGRYDDNTDVGNYEQAKARYNKTRSAIMDKIEAPSSNDDEIDEEDLDEIDGRFRVEYQIPTFGKAVTYAQIGDFLVQYPNFLFQIELVTVKAWSKLSPDEEKCRETIQERRTFCFISKIFTQNPNLANFWKGI
jgi:hypothetical protein